MEIDLLANHPEFIETLAPVASEHWKTINPAETVKGRIEKYQKHLNRDSLPLAWVAFSEQWVFGIAALRRFDLPDRMDLSPWLGGVFVVPDFRRRGIGEALCKEVELYAKSLENTQKLFLFTLDLQRWYEKMGWKFYDDCIWQGNKGVIMQKDLSAA